jgi:hypothetical protein
VVHFASPFLVIPSAIPHFGYSVGFYTWERRNSHLVPWNIYPGDGILNKLEPHIHKGYVWLFRFLSDTCHKWDSCLVPVWRGAHWGDSVPWAVPPPIAAGSFPASTVLLLFWQRVLVWIPLPVWVQFRISSISYGWYLYLLLHFAYPNQNITYIHRIDTIYRHKRLLSLSWPTVQLMFSHFCLHDCILLVFFFQGVNRILLNNFLALYV